DRQHECSTLSPYCNASDERKSFDRRRKFHTATLLPDGRALIVGRASADLYDPETGTFRPAGLIESPAADCPSAALLNNGKVLIVFGAYYPGPKERGFPAPGVPMSAHKHFSTFVTSGPELTNPRSS